MQLSRVLIGCVDQFVQIPLRYNQVIQALVPRGIHEYSQPLLTHVLFGDTVELKYLHG